MARAPLRAVLHHQGGARATYLLERLAEEAGRAGIAQPSTLNTPYVNTIPPEPFQRARLGGGWFHRCPRPPEIIRSPRWSRNGPPPDRSPPAARGLLPQLLRPGRCAHSCKRHQGSGLRPNRRTGLAFGRARALIGGHRQCDGNPAEAALDFALDVKRKLAGAELGEMNAIPGAQSANCP